VIKHKNICNSEIFLQNSCSFAYNSDNGFTYCTCRGYLGDKAQKYLQQRLFSAKLLAHLPTTAALGLSTVLAVATMGDKTE
jgi:hypothetical protein